MFNRRLSGYTCRLYGRLVTHSWIIQDRLVFLTWDSVIKTSVPQHTFGLTLSSLIQFVLFWSVDSPNCNKKGKVCKKQAPNSCRLSLRGRRLKGKGKGVLGARERRGARPPPSRVVSRPNSLPFRTPATQASAASKFTPFR